MTLTFGSLFAGIGGIDLGLERAGMKCIWQVEIDDYARRVLAKHWPAVQRYRDVRFFLGGKRWRRARMAWRPDLICGGFPCQDISNAGQRAGIDGRRSGLWSEFLRIIRLLRPRIVLVENVAALLGRGMGRVVGDLAECGYDAEWDCIPCAALGAVHIRNRVFLLAYPDSERSQKRWNRPLGWIEREKSPQEAFAELTGLGCPGIGGGRRFPDDVHDSYRRRYGTSQETVFAGRGGIELSDWWASEPDVGRVVDGIPNRVDRCRLLGNAVVPQVAEWIGRRIVEATEAQP